MEKKKKNFFGDKKIIKENNKNEILHIEIFEENKLMILYDNNIVTKKRTTHKKRNVQKSFPCVVHISKCAEFQLLLLVFSFYEIDFYIQSQLVGNLDDHIDRRIIIRLFEAADVRPGHTKSIGNRLL